MVKRTLSDGELFAHSKNRHELNHLKMKLEEIKYQEIQSEEVNRIEKHKWRDFLRSNSRNSGKASLAMSSDSRGDEQEGIWPTSARDRFDLQTVEKYQRQWVIAYHSHSHNKLYREIEQAGASMQRSQKSPRPLVSVGSASSGDIAGLSKYATAVMGIKRVRNKMEDRRPKTSVAEYRNEEIVDINLNKPKTSYTAPWLWRDDNIPNINTGESLSNKTSHSSEASSPPQEPTSNKLIESVYSMQAVVKSKDAWRCSVCGHEKPSADRFANTVLVYKDLNKILNNLQSKSTSSLPDPDSVPEEPKRKSSTPRIYCRCRKTSFPVAAEKRLSLTASLSTPLTKRSANLKLPKSPTVLTHPKQNIECSRKEDTSASNVNKESDRFDPDKSKNISRSSMDNYKSPSTSETDVVDVVGVPKTAAVDILTGNHQEDAIVHHEIGESETDIDNETRTIRATDVDTSRRSVINQNEKSNLVMSSQDDLDQSLTATNQSSDNNGGYVKKDGPETILHIKIDNETRSLKTKETCFDKDFVTAPKCLERNEEISHGTLPKSTNSSKVIKPPQSVKCDDKCTINLKAGESFFERAAQTMNAKLAEKREMETSIASYDRNRPRILKYDISPYCSKPNNCTHSNHGVNVIQEKEIKGINEMVNDGLKHQLRSQVRQIPVRERSNTREQNNTSIVAGGENVPDRITSTIRAKSVEPFTDFRKTSGTGAIEIPSMGEDVSGTLSNSPEVLNNDLVQSPVQQDRDSLRSAKSKGATLLQTSARSYRGNGQQIWKHLEFKGIVIKNYVPPHLRYKTAASDRMKRSLSIHGRGPHGNAVVTVHEKHDKSRLVDIIFPKQARQKLLLKLIEENHRKPPSTARFVADADLRRRIDSFMKSVEPYCPR